MSNSVSLMCAIKLTREGVGMIIEGVRELNMEVEENKKIVNCEGITEKVDLLITNEEGQKIGVRKDEDGNASFILEEKESEEMLKTINKIRQRYSKIKIMNEVRKKGYNSVKEEVLSNGKIRLVVEKWG